MQTDLQTSLPGDLLVKADRMTMAHSLEGRSPFLDHELIGWAARLPEEMKVRGRTGKVLLRQTFEDDLPERVLRRGKQGFGIPVGAWFRGPLAEWAREVLTTADGILDRWFEPAARHRLLDEHFTGRANHGKRIYALAVLALWDRIVTP